MQFVIEPEPTTVLYVLNPNGFFFAFKSVIESTDYYYMREPFFAYTYNIRYILFTAEKVSKSKTVLTFFPRKMQPEFVSKICGVSHFIPIQPRLFLLFTFYISYVFVILVWFCYRYFFYSHLASFLSLVLFNIILYYFDFCLIFFNFLFKFK